MIYGPGMSGGRMTGYAPIFSAAEKRAGAAPVIQRGSLISGGIPGTNTPAMFQQPQAPGDARPIIDPDTGKIVGYSGKDIHMMPQPKESPEDYETEVTKTPGTKGTEGEPGLPGQPAVRHFGGLWTSPAIPPTPGNPGAAGTPEKTITRRIPVAGKPEESGDITYLKPPQPPGAPKVQWIQFIRRSACCVQGWQAGQGERYSNPPEPVRDEMSDERDRILRLRCRSRVVKTVSSSHTDAGR